MGSSPITFMCATKRREQWRYVNMRTGAPLPGATRQPEHTTTRTGRSKPNTSRRRTSRTLDRAHEYRCTCGHVGWSTQIGVLALGETAREDAARADLDRYEAPPGPSNG